MSIFVDTIIIQKIFVTSYYIFENIECLDIFNRPRVICRSNCWQRIHVQYQQNFSLRFPEKYGQKFVKRYYYLGSVVNTI